MTEQEELKQQATELKLHGLIAHWHKITDEQHPWLAQWLRWELVERKQRSLERRLASAKLGRFKPLSEFDWQWPRKIEQQAVQRLMQLEFLTNASNIIFMGGNGVGKSTIAQNIGYNICKHHFFCSVAIRSPSQLNSWSWRTVYGSFNNSCDRLFDNGSFLW